MLEQDRSGRIRRAFFTGLVEIRCFDLQSFSVMILVCLVRFITETMIMDFSQLVSDPWLDYLFIAEKKISVGEQLGLTVYLLCGLIVIIWLCLSFFYCLFTVKLMQKTQRFKTMYMKGFSLIIYTFRVFLIKGLSQIIASNYSSGSIEYLVLAALAIIGLIAIMLVVEEFYVSISLQSHTRSLLIKSAHPFNAISQGILLGTVILAQFMQTFDNTIVLNAVLCALFMTSYILRLCNFSTIIHLVTSTLRKKYLNSIMQCIEKVHCMFGIIFYLLVVPGNYIELLGDNLLLMVIIVVIFCVASYTNYVESLRHNGVNYLQSTLKTKQELQTRKGQFYLLQAHYLIHYINHLMVEYKSEKQQIMISGVFSEHIRKCKSPQCFCTRVTEQNNLQKVIMERDFRGQFMLSFVENIEKEFSHQFDIFSLYLMFKLQVIGIFPQTEHQLWKYETTNHGNLKLVEKYILFQIRRALKKTVLEKNRQISTVNLEKAILQQQKCKYLINLMRSMVQLTIKKYNLLGEAITNLKLVEENINKTIAMVKEIELGYTEEIGRNSYNLYTQSILYQYFTSISETNAQAKTILNSIITKSHLLRTIKGITTQNMQRYLYEDTCCVIETGIEPDNMGNITNLNENSLNVFGLRKDQLLYHNIKKVIPKQFNQQHESLMKHWLSTASYKNINHLKDIYLTNSKKIVFKAIVYHQITISMDRVKFYIMVLKFNGDNFMILDNKLGIVGFGDKIKDNILSVKALKQPLNRFCLNPKALPLNINDLKIDKDYKIDLLLCEEKGDFGEVVKTYDPTMNLAQQIQQFAMTVLHSTRQLRVLKCKVLMNVMTFGHLKYLTLKLIDVIEHTMLQSDIQQFQERTPKLTVEVDHSRKGTSITMGKQKVLLGENSFTNTIEDLRSRVIDEEQGGDENQTKTEMNSEQERLMQNYDVQKQSTSSVSKDSVSYSFKKLIKIIKEKFLFEKNVTYRQLNNITLVLALLIIILFAALIAQYIFYKSRLVYFQNVMDANQQVSDTLQYVELMFSQCLLIYQNCVILPNQSQCQNAIQSVTYSQQNLFEQVSMQAQNFISSMATEDFPFYSYLNDMVYVKVGRAQSLIPIQQFLSVFYYSVKKIALNFKLNQTMNSQMQQLFSILNDNWDLIVKINHDVLTIYQEKGLQQMSLISIVLFSISGCVIFLNLLLVVVINYFMVKAEDKREKLMRNYQFIPISYVETLKRYYQKLFDILHSSKNTKLMLRQQEFPVIEDSPFYRPKSEFLYSRSYAKRLFVLFLFFVCLSGSNLFSLNEMHNVLEPFETIFVQETLMIGAQKKVIEAFYQLKKDYLLQTNATVRQGRLNALNESFQRTSVQFDDRAITLLQIFNDSTSQYFTDFKHLLKDDICEISKSLVNQWEYNVCKNALLSYPQYGIFPTMIQTQRIAMLALVVLQGMPQQTIMQSAPVFLNQDVFADIDRYVLYVTKVFYLMQVRINQEMKNFLQSAYFSSFIMIMIQFILTVLGMIFWVFFYRKKKQQFIKLYGHVIIFPNQVIIKNKIVISSIEEGLLIKDY